jgi:hypothetical protein
MGKMSEYVTLRECPKCGGEPREAMQDYTYAVSVCCSVCSHGTRWCGNAAQAWAEWDKLTDPALAVKDARIKELEAELEDVRDRLDAVKKSLLQRDKALDVQRERIAELERELFALKRPVGQGHDVDDYYKPDTCERCKWGGYRERTGFVWCARPSGPGEWTDTDGKPGCDKWEAKEVADA